jgi:hypothetical protein
LPLEADRRAETGGDEQIQSGMREVCGHDGTPGEPNDATLTKPGAFVPNRRRIHVEFSRKKHHLPRLEH